MAYTNVLRGNLPELQRWVDKFNLDLRTPSAALQWRVDEARNFIDQYVMTWDNTKDLFDSAAISPDIKKTFRTLQKAQHVSHKLKVTALRDDEVFLRHYAALADMLPARKADETRAETCNRIMAEGLLEHYAMACDPRGKLYSGAQVDAQEILAKKYAAIGGALETGLTPDATMFDHEEMLDKKSGALVLFNLVARHCSKADHVRADKNLRQVFDLAVDVRAEMPDAFRARVETVLGLVYDMPAQPRADGAKLAQVRARLQHAAR